MQTGTGTLAAAEPAVDPHPPGSVFATCTPRNTTACCFAQRASATAAARQLTLATSVNCTRIGSQACSR